MNPLLSVVIVNYNYGRFLETAIRSVIEQEAFDQCELIVVDGGSTDNSVEIIKKYAGDLLPNTRGGDPNSLTQGSSSHIAWWVSEPDKGQSDAFNKAFAHCRGKYLTWLNADDIMPRGAISAILKQLKRHPKCEWFTGNLFRFVDEPVCEVGEVHGQRDCYTVCEVAWGPNYLPRWLQSKGQPVAVYGPATVFTKGLFDRVGGMKVEQYFMMDTDLWMRFIVAGVKQRRINAFLWAFRMHRDSKTAEFGDHKLSPEQRAKFEAERERSVEETGYKASPLNHRMIQLWRMLDGSIVKELWLRKRFRLVGGVGGLVG